MWITTADGSILDSTGKLIYISVERLEQHIVREGYCFVCASTPMEKPFNEEHILPEWLLRRYSLFDRTVTLPNKVGVRYGGYTVPCCTECNELMARTFEEPISAAVQGGIGPFIDLLTADPLKVYTWLSLIYVKTHLRDRGYRVHLDARNGTELIADGYDWAHLHHVYTFARHFYTGCKVGRNEMGSFFGAEVRSEGLLQRFYYANLYLAQTTLMRLDDIALFAVFDDAGGAGMRLQQQWLNRITGPVSEVQARELMIELAFLNMRIRERPLFQTHIDIEKEESNIIVHRPRWAFEEPDLQARGMLLENAVSEFIEHLQIAGRSRSEIVDAVRSGRMSYLFDDEGDFITQSYRFD
jgi:hypothetical protein